MAEEIQLTAARILGEWAMMLVEPESPEHGVNIFESDEPFLCAALHFTGIIAGRYVIVCQKPFAQILAQNLLCGEEAVSDEEVLDALKEMVNVFSGNLLTATYGNHEVFALTSPEAETISREKAKAELSKNVIWLRGDGEPVGIAFVPEVVKQ